MNFLFPILHLYTYTYTLDILIIITKYKGVPYYRKCFGSRDTSLVSGLCLKRLDDCLEFGFVVLVKESLNEMGNLLCI